MPTRPDDLPRGLVVPGLRASDGRRGWVITLLVVTVAAGLALTWPGYALIPPVEPYVLGLPFSLAWVVGWMAAIFGALVGLYRAEPDDE